ncbi:MAG: four helix bundle protein [Chloroflexota bacterium]|nr:four helix bundle protein [Chloroflexota bacterium]
MAVYGATKNWPCEEQFGGLTSQVRKAAVSIHRTLPRGTGEQDPESSSTISQSLDGLRLPLRGGNPLMIAEQLSYMDAFVTETLMASIAAARRLLGGLLGSVRETGSHR